MVCRLSGWMIMKMIRSTSSTSIIGVTLMSEFRPPPPPAAIAISVLLAGAAQHATLLFGHRGQHPDPGTARHFDGLLDLGVLHGHVGLEIQHLILGAGRVDGLELGLELVQRDRP